MPANAVVRARISEEIKEEASVVLAAMGLTVSDAFRIMLTRVAREKALPFEPLVPKKGTIKGYCQVNKLGNRKVGMSAVVWRQKRAALGGWINLSAMVIPHSVQPAHAFLLT